MTNLDFVVLVIALYGWANAIYAHYRINKLERRWPERTR